MKKQIYYIMVVLGVVLMLFTACEYDGPDAVWDPNVAGEPSPVITGLDPAETAGPGVLEIVINGQNFAGPDQVAVYFDDVLADVKSSSPTQIVVYRPNLIQEDITIRVANQLSLEIAEFTPYTLTEVYEAVGEFESNTMLYALAVDLNENLYLMSRRLVYQISPDGVTSEYSATGFTNCTDMKTGPGGVLYFARNDEPMYRLAPGAAEDEQFIEMPNRVSAIDFTADGHLIAGGRESGLYMIDVDALTFGTFDLDFYGDYEIVSLRVYDGYVYVAATYRGSDDSAVEAGIWRNAIEGGSISESQELLIDWMTLDEYAEEDMNSITFDADGTLYIATSADTDPVILRYADGTMGTFYGGGIVPGPVDDIVWGNDGYLYFYRSGSDEFGRVLRLGMVVEGAPYFGRQ